MKVALFVCIGLCAVSFSYAAMGTICSGNGDCATNEACMKISPCEKGGCYCKSGYYYKSNVCTANVKIGDACTTVADCGQLGSNSQCTAGACECKVGASEKDGVCVRDTLNKGDACPSSSVARCADPFSCVGGTCACENTNYDANSCLGKMPEEACTANQCHNNLVCTSSACACTAPATWNGEIKYCTDVTYTLGKGDSCTQSSKTQCKLGLQCATCPEAATTYICVESHGAKAAAGILTILPVLLAILFRI